MNENGNVINKVATLGQLAESARLAKEYTDDVGQAAQGQIDKLNVSTVALEAIAAEFPSAGDTFADVYGLDLVGDEQKEITCTFGAFDSTLKVDSTTTMESVIDKVNKYAGKENAVVFYNRLSGQLMLVNKTTGELTELPLAIDDEELQPVAKVELVTKTQMAEAVAAADHLKRKKVTSIDEIDPAADDAEQYIYMVPKTGSDEDDAYDEYMVLDGSVEHVGNTKVDLTGYVEKEDGKGLSEENFTPAEKSKLAGIAIATDEEVAAALAEIYGGGATTTNPDEGSNDET